MSGLRRALPLAAVLGALALPAAATADYHAVITECARYATLDHHYSRHELETALKRLPTDVDEYTDCRALIEAALRRFGNGGSAGGGPGGGGGAVAAGPGSVKTQDGATAANPADAAALKADTTRARSGRKPSIVDGGQAIVPAASGIGGGASNDLPVSLLVAILAVAALCALGGIAAAWRRWPSVVRAPLRLIRR